MVRKRSHVPQPMSVRPRPEDILGVLQNYVHKAHFPPHQLLIKVLGIHSPCRSLTFECNL
ncbi:hypothetical protein B0H34DRAFT_735584 [Crassisporium funariophilum]|nr:hypothetical protein B0H34DRAFT_735584 [Crassisporium funariophilum]